MRKLMVLFLSTALCACSSIRHVSNKVFESEYENSKLMHSMHHYEYLGERNGKVYLKKTSMSLLNSKKWKDKIFVADLDSLREPLKKELMKLDKKYKTTPEPKP